MVKTADDKEKYICFPGQRLCAMTEYTVGGEGTYEKLGYLHASLSGVVRIRKHHKVVLTFFMRDYSLQFIYCRIIIYL